MVGYHRGTTAEGGADMWVLKPAGIIILVLLGYLVFKPGKMREVSRNAGRSVRAFKEEAGGQADRRPEERDD